MKRDWSAEGMEYILIQPADDPESDKTTKQLQKNGQYLFDLCEDGARLKSVKFGSRTCVELKCIINFGEAAAGWWDISHNMHLLWRNNFLWMCDCMVVRETLKYKGNILQIFRWAQELS